MNFDAPGIVRSFLTTLVVDLRNSSAFFQYLRLSQVEAFVDEFSAITTKVMDEVIGHVPDQVQIVKFTGDGFLILLAEPDDLVRDEMSEATRQATGASTVLGPGRALAIARHLREHLQMMLPAWNAFVLARQGHFDVGVVSGIVDGHVSYGKVASPTSRQPDVLGEPVVRTFRFAQLRDDALTDADADRILLCGTSRQEIERFLADTTIVGENPAVDARVRGVQFEAVDLPRSVTGVANTVCFQAIWGAEESATA